jgi:serpin B
LSALAGSKKTAQVEVGTSLWTRKQAPIRPDFIRQVKRSYRAEVRSLDFASPNAVPQINRWVRNATHGKIQSVVTMIPKEIIAYLVNVVYFQGKWTYPFVPKDTHSHRFTAANGRTRSVAMMRQTKYLSYFQGRDVQVVSLPYGEQARYSMVVVLPRPGVSLQRVVESLTPATWQNWTSHLRPNVPVDLSLPRFNFRYDTSLKPDLQALGMSSAFAPTANLTGMCTSACWLSEVKHKTFIHVDEKGTVAAGVTTIGLGAGGIPRTATRMIVDRPFLVVIRDQQTGTILFLGATRAP